MPRDQIMRYVNRYYFRRSLPPLGEGAFGTVHKAINRATGEEVALKKIPKKYTSNDDFQKEMAALTQIRAYGGHPNITSLRENFDDGKYYYLILDLVLGGEMFDQLCNNGPYSEADASRLMREVASALAFLHGIGVVHADLKPENLMLSSNKSSDAVIKIVDFGCSQLLADDDWDANEDEGEFYSHFGSIDHHLHASGTESSNAIGKTPAYSPPEAFKTPTPPILPSTDMWALGTILFIMLTGLHPFDMSGRSTDEEIEELIVSSRSPPLNSPLTKHLSKSAIDLIQRLMSPNSEDRMSAHELLEHPWVTGETAKKDVMVDSDSRLCKFREFKTRIEAKVFADAIDWSDESTATLGVSDGNDADSDVTKKTCLIERAFQSFDVKRKGFVTTDDIASVDGLGQGDVSDEATRSNEEKAKMPSLSLSGFSDLLGKNMKNKYFPRGKIVYQENDEGNHMYFINSGTIEVRTSAGTQVIRSAGDFFGEGALLHPKKIRSATIRCLTPVHAIEISREYFEKYLSSSNANLKLNLKEKDKTRKRNRAKTILRLQNNLKSVVVHKEDKIFKEGDPGNTLYILEKGNAAVFVQGHKVFNIDPGDLTGEHSLILSRARNSTAICLSDVCKLHEMKARDFYALLDSSSSTKQSLREMCLRREVQKAVVVKTRRSFPSGANLKDAFDTIDEKQKGFIDQAQVRNILLLLDSTLSEDETQEVIDTLDLDESGVVTFDAFKRIFGKGTKQAASI